MEVEVVQNIWKAWAPGPERRFIAPTEVADSFALPSHSASNRYCRRAGPVKAVS